MTNDSSSIRAPRVGVVGGSGYTGRELLRILAGHRGVQTRWATSRSEAGRPTAVRGLPYQDLGFEALEDRVDEVRDLDAQLGGMDRPFIEESGKDEAQ